MDQIKFNSAKYLIHGAICNNNICANNIYNKPYLLG